MGRSLLDQLVQINGSGSYDDAVASVNTIGVAEAQASLEGDLNVLRSLIVNLKGSGKAWYEDPDLTVDGLAQKYVRAASQPAGFINQATGTGTSSNAFDTAIKTITGHNNGGGNSTTEGVIVDSTFAHKLIIRDHDTQDAINDGSGNEVYGRLSWATTEYVINWYSWVAGVETAYDFITSVDIDLIEVLVSRQWQDFPWDHPYHPSFHDTSGFTGSVDDDNVVVDGMTDLLNGLVTQAQVNGKLDDLGSVANGEGASLIAVEDASAYYAGADVEAVLNELEAQLGGDTSSTYAFTEDNVLADNDALYAALNKLDLKWGDLASVVAGEGASLVGIEDSAGNFTATDVEAALAELYQFAQDIEIEKEVAVNVGPITSGTAVTIPNAKSYTLGSGLNMDVYVNGQLMVEGATEDYTETTTTSVTFNFTISAGSNITYIIRK